MHDKAGHVAASCIDLVQRRQALFLELIWSPAADDLHPMRGRRAPGLPLEHLQRQRKRGHSVPTDLLRIGQAAANEMRVGIVETGNDGAATCIDDFSRWRTQSFEIRARANPNDLVAADRNRLGARHFRVEGDDLCVLNNPIGL